MAPSEPMCGNTAIGDTVQFTMANSEPLHQTSVVPSLQPILAQQIEPNQVQDSQSLANSILLQYFTLVSYVLGSANNSRCFPVLGCVEISEKWFDLSRPINLLPLDRQVVNTQFLLRTRHSLQARKLYVEDPQGVLEAGYDGKKPTRLIIHGFIDSGFESWITEMTDALLALEDCNVIAVDWGGGSLPFYSQAAANARLVGLEVAHLVNSLVAQHGPVAGQVHIIGHSLGAHVAGYAGEKIPGLGRISGLDPAEPLFQGMPPFVRLDPTDALFVDVIHTDSKSILVGGWRMEGWGMEEPTGHVDFYPNGGETQPGCSLQELPSLSSLSVEDITLPSADTVGRHVVACAHNRAIHLYTDSIRNSRSCPMLGHRCDSYSQFQSGSCYHCLPQSGDCAAMGWPATRHRSWSGGPVRMYLDTGPLAPYCSHHYLLELHLARPREAEAWVQGHLKVNLYGDRGELTGHQLTPGLVSLQPGSSSTFLVSSPLPLGALVLAELHFSGSLSWTCLHCNRRLSLHSLAFHHHNGSTELVESSSPLCGEETRGLSYSDIESGTWKLFYPQNCPHT